MLWIWLLLLAVCVVFIQAVLLINLIAKNRIAYNTLLQCEKVLNAGSDLSAMFNLQSVLQKLHGHNFEAMTIEDREQYTKDHVLYLLEETHELLREINFKTYKKVRKPVKPENIREELCDILHFFVNLCLVWNVTPQQLLDAFIEKNKKNVERVNNQSY